MAKEKKSPDAQVVRVEPNNAWAGIYISPTLTTAQKYVTYMEKVIDSVKWHVGVMGLEHWTINVRWDGDPEEGAEATARPAYYRADLAFNLEEIAADEGKHLDSYVIHELLHCIIWLYADSAETLVDDESKVKVLRNLEERIVTDLQRMPIWRRRPT